MNTTATLEKMQQLKLQGMTRVYKQSLAVSQKGLTPDELVAHLVEGEYEERHNRKQARLIKAAGFREQASLPQIDFASARNLDKNLILRLTDVLWIKDASNIIITGPTGAGKSYLASALGHGACVNGFRVRYFNCNKLFPFLKLQKADGSYSREISKIEKQQLLILDDFGLKLLDTQDRLSLLEILEDRYGLSSTIIVSQLPTSAWHEVIGDQTIADSICDRLVHNAHQIELKGGTMRRKKPKIS